MALLKCELCGSADLVKSDGVFVCQFCGCKYSVDDAKKLIIDGIVEVQGTIKLDSAESVSALIKRAIIFLENEEWDKADEYCEKALDMEPESAKAYIIKLMSELRIKNEDDLAQTDVPLNEFHNFKKAIEFADQEYVVVLSHYAMRVNEKFYQKTLCSIENCMNIDEYNAVITAFKRIQNYKDSPTYIAILQQTVNEIQKITSQNEENRKNEISKATDEITKRKKTLTTIGFIVMFLFAIVVIGEVIITFSSSDGFLDFLAYFCMFGIIDIPIWFLAKFLFYLFFDSFDKKTKIEAAVKEINSTYDNLLEKEKIKIKLLIKVTK